MRILGWRGYGRGQCAHGGKLLRQLSVGNILPFQLCFQMDWLSATHFVLSAMMFPACSEKSHHTRCVYNNVSRQDLNNIIAQIALLKPTEPAVQLSASASAGER